MSAENSILQAWTSLTHFLRALVSIGLEVVDEKVGKLVDSLIILSLVGPSFNWPKQIARDAWDF